MNELGGGQTQQLETVGPEGFPEGGAPFLKLCASFSLRLFFVELFKGRILCEGILEVTVE